MKTVKEMYSHLYQPNGEMREEYLERVDLWKQQPPKRALPVWLEDALKTKNSKTKGPYHYKAVYLWDVPLDYFTRSDGTWIRDISAYKDDSEVVCVTTSEAQEMFTETNQAMVWNVEKIVAAVKVPSDPTQECVIVDTFDNQINIKHLPQETDSFCCCLLDAYEQVESKGHLAKI